MPNPPLSDEKKRDAVAAVAEHGSIGAAARALGMPEKTLAHRYRLGVRDGHQDPAIAASMAATGTNMTPQLAWVKTKGENGGPGYSVLLKPQSLPDDTLDRIRAAFEGMAPAPPVPQPERVMADLCNVFPMFDVHWGMLAWGRETNGQDYDLELAASDLNQAVESVVGMVPFAKQAVIIIGGDFFHVDDSSNETPKSRHKQDTAAKYQKIVATAIDSLKLAVARIQSRHERTLIRVIRGNHDEHSHTVLTFALAERYRNDSTVTVERNPSELFMFQWGRAAIFAHHGDKAPPERQALYLSDICPFWSETRHRHYYTGHIHKDVARDVGPLRWESLRAFCPPDSYAAGMGYASRRALRADTYHVRNGRVLTAHDPIERG